jgi:anti-anti-sigma regulatory factor
VEALPMTFRIKRLVSEENAMVFTVCGRLDIECLDTLKELIEAEDAKIVLDLSEVTLAGRDAATSLAGCEFKGIELRNCPAFLRGWIDKEQERIMP